MRFAGPAGPTAAFTRLTTTSHTVLSRLVFVCGLFDLFCTHAHASRLWLFSGLHFSVRVTVVMAQQLLCYVVWCLHNNSRYIGTVLVHIVRGLNGVFFVPALFGPTPASERLLGRRRCRLLSGRILRYMMDILDDTACMCSYSTAVVRIWAATSICPTWRSSVRARPQSVGFVVWPRMHVPGER